MRDELDVRDGHVGLITGGNEGVNGHFHFSIMFLVHVSKP